MLWLGTFGGAGETVLVKCVGLRGIRCAFPSSKEVSALETWRRLMMHSSPSKDGGFARTKHLFFHEFTKPGTFPMVRSLMLHLALILQVCE